MAESLPSLQEEPTAEETPPAKKGLFALEKFAPDVASPVTDESSFDYNNFDASINNGNNNGATTSSDSQQSVMLGRLFNNLLSNIKHSMDNNEETMQLDYLTFDTLKQSLESLAIIEMNDTSINRLKSIFINDNSINRNTFIDRISNFNDSDDAKLIQEQIIHSAMNSNNDGINENPSAMFFGTRTKSVSVINNDSSLKDALNKKNKRKSKKLVNFDKDTKNKLIKEEINNNTNENNNNNNENNINESSNDKHDHKHHKVPNLLKMLQKSARHDPNFADVYRCPQWTSQEVCYWLITNDLETIIHKFYNKSITGAMLLNNDFKHEILEKNDIKLHKNERDILFKSIKELKKQMQEPDSRRNSLAAGNNVTAIVVTNETTNNNNNNNEEIIGLKNEINSLKSMNNVLKESHQRELSQMNQIINELKNDIENEKKESEILRVKLRKSQSDALEEYVELTIAAIKINFAEVPVTYDELKDQCKDVPFHSMFQHLTNFMNQKSNQMAT